MLILGTVVLWWNEGNFVEVQQMLEEAQGNCVHVEDVSKVNPEYEGQLIHAVAATKTTDSISDPMFAVGAVCVKINRSIEYYQWVENKHTETKDKVGGGQEEITTYTYEQKWVSEPVNSSEFADPQYKGIKNTPRLQGIEDNKVQAENVTFGAYKLPSFLISSISGDKPFILNIPKAQIDHLNAVASGKQANLQQQKMDAANHAVTGTALCIATDSSAVADAEFVHQNANKLYIGRSEAAPEAGDVRITFTYVLPGTASVIGKAQNDTFTKYVAKNGRTLSVLTMGTHSMEEMFQTENENNSTETWFLRIVGILLVILGIKSIFSILYMLFKILPFLADIVEMGVGLVAGILGLAWSLIVIAIAWLFYRPLIGILVLAAVVGLITWGVMKGKRKKLENAAKA